MRGDRVRRPPRLEAEPAQLRARWPWTLRPSWLQESGACGKLLSSRLGAVRLLPAPLESTPRWAPCPTPAPACPVHVPRSRRPGCFPPCATVFRDLGCFSRSGPELAFPCSGPRGPTGRGRVRFLSRRQPRPVPRFFRSRSRPSAVAQHSGSLSPDSRTCHPSWGITAAARLGLALRPPPPHGPSLSPAHSGFCPPGTCTAVHFHLSQVTVFSFSLFCSWFIPCYVQCELCERSVYT